MKKFVYNSSLFAAFGTIFYALLIFLWGSFSPIFLKPNLNYLLGAYGHMFTRSQEVKRVKNPDILFIGSSHTYRGFDPRIFDKYGYSTFNLGSSSQSPIQSLTLLRRYLDSINPKTIVYEVYPEALTSDGVESSLDIVSNDQNDIHSYVMAYQINNIKVWNTLVYGTIRDFFKMNNGFVEPQIIEDDTYKSGGFVEKQIQFYKPHQLDEKEIRLTQDQLGYLKHIIDEIKKRNINLILVYAPIPKVNYKRFINNHYFDRLMTNYGKYYNFNTILELDDSLHFYDADHLNQIGVSIFNEALVKKLRDENAGDKHIN